MNMTGRTAVAYKFSNLGPNYIRLCVHAPWCSGWVHEMSYVCGCVPVPAGVRALLPARVRRTKHCATPRSHPLLSQFSVQGHAVLGAGTAPPPVIDAIVVA